MARFLFCPAPEPGDLFPTVPLALALRSRGHDVAYVLDPDLDLGLEHAGVRSFFVRNGVYGPEAPRVPERPCAALQRLPAQVELLGRVCDDFCPNVLVDGTFPFAPRLLAERRSLPHASLFAGCYPIPTRDPLFPHGPGLPPPTTERGRTLARLSTLIQRDREADEVAVWDAARASLGLRPSGGHPWRSAASPWLVLLASSPAFEYPRTDLPPQFWFIGPLLWQAPLAAMPDRIAALSTDEPIVYVSQGATYNAHPVVIELAIAALGGEPVRVVATVVRDFDPAEFGALPANVMLERFVPFLDLVDRLSLAITHAGAGAVHAALSRGIPLVLLPLTADQSEIAARCEWAGAGIRLDPTTCTPEALRTAVRRVLAEPGFRANARRIMASHARLNAPDLGASLLERLAETRQPVLRPASADPWATTTL
ncbi:glycosyltransferase [Nannocystis pusilla]|uniref:glycosyltransferase n=1 Tax=Nannocystis pusilla TaxID=889268 RepID=UPI003DA458E3